MTTRRPNLFLVGAMRSGTTALHEVLANHGDIFMSGYKEPAHFTDPDQLADDSDIVSSAGYSGNLDRYLTLFEDAGSERYVGESSTHYTKYPRIGGVPERIADFSPAARILYLVRDPVERALSHYRFEVRRKRERLDPFTAFKSDPFYAAVSNYAMQIKPYLSVFGDDNIRLLLLEDLVESPEEELGSLAEWLDVASFAVSQLPKRNAVAERLTMAQGPDILHKVGKSSTYQTLATRLVPVSLRSRIRDLLNREHLVDDEISSKARIYLREELEPTISDLESLFGLDLARWRKQ